MSNVNRLATLVLADRVILRASLRVEAVFGWAPKDLEGMRFTDYKRLQDSYFRLVSARPDDRATAEPADEATGAGTALPAL